MSFNIIPVASGYQEIHPFSVINIGSVKINTDETMVFDKRESFEIFNDCKQISFI